MGKSFRAGNLSHFGRPLTRPKSSPALIEQNSFHLVAGQDELGLRRTLLERLSGVASARGAGALLVGLLLVTPPLSCSREADDVPAAGSGRSADETEVSSLQKALLTTAEVEQVVDDLARREYQDGDFAVLEATELTGWAEEAEAGVQRQWSRPYSWQFGEEVPNMVVRVTSTVLEFSDPATAEAASRSLTDQLGDLRPLGDGPGGFDLFGPVDRAHPTDLQSWLAVRVSGSRLEGVQLDAAGDEDRRLQLVSLVEMRAESSG